MASCALLSIGSSYRESIIFMRLLASNTAYLRDRGSEAGVGLRTWVCLLVDLSVRLVGGLPVLCTWLFVKEYGVG